MIHFFHFLCKYLFSSAEHGTDFVSTPLAEVGDTKESNQIEEDCSRGERIPEIADSVIRLCENHLSICVRFSNFVYKNLLVREHPHGKDRVQDWSHKHHLHAGLIGLSAEHGRLAVIVRHHESLSTVEHQDGKPGDGEQNWKSSTKEEGDKHNNQEVRILVMQIKLWTCISFDEVFNRFAGGVFLLCRAE